MLSIVWHSGRKTKTLVEQKLSENLSESGKEKYSNFYLEGSQNIDLTDFKLLINNDICGDDDIKIVTIVTTALENNVSDVFTCYAYILIVILPGLSRCYSQVLGISQYTRGGDKTGLHDWISS